MNKPFLASSVFFSLHSASLFDSFGSFVASLRFGLSVLSSWCLSSFFLSLSDDSVLACEWPCEWLCVCLTAFSTNKNVKIPAKTHRPTIVWPEWSWLPSECEWECECSSEL